MAEYKENSISKAFIEGFAKGIKERETMKKNYEVKVNYTRFEFDNFYDANLFMDFAKKGIIKNDDNKIEMHITYDEEEEDEV